MAAADREAGVGMTLIGTAAPTGTAARTAATSSPPPTPPGVPCSRARRVLTWAAAAVSILVVVGAAGFGVLWTATPSVADAPVRVAAILAAHHAPSDNGVVATKVATAVLATEDSRFYRDPALDPAGTARAAWGLVTHNRDESGATIEIQLAKLLYTGGRSGLADQVEQVGLAFKLDSHFTKAQILAMYLDAAYFGDGAYGISAAADRYFGLRPDQLSWAQASLLAGLLQAPSAYDPHLHLRAALARRGDVLDRLVATGTLSRAQADQVRHAPLRPIIAFNG